eukprot:COSAG05_NODE_3800_length_1831_cov_32.714203_3_plen_106_part_00
MAAMWARRTVWTDFGRLRVWVACDNWCADCFAMRSIGIVTMGADRAIATALACVHHRRCLLAFGSGSAIRHGGKLARAVVDCSAIAVRLSVTAVRGLETFLLARR